MPSHFSRFSSPSGNPELATVLIQHTIFFHLFTFLSSSFSKLFFQVNRFIITTKPTDETSDQVTSFFPFSFILFFLIFSARGWSCAFHSAGLPPREREPTYLTSFPTVMLAITFFTASFFRSFLSLFNSAFNSNISPANVTVLKASVCNLLCYVGLESSCCVFFALVK